MTALSQIPLPEAEHTFAVANTPLYLIRKLRQDPIVYEISRSFSGDQILAELNRALSVKPSALADYVRPFVYLVALWHMREDRYLKLSPEKTDAGEREWYNYVRRFLLETYSPTIDVTVQIPPKVTSGVQSDAPFTFKHVDLRRG